MGKFSKILGVSVLSLTVLLSGCNLFGGENPQEVLREMTKNLANVESGEFDMKPSMVMKTPEGDFNFDIELSGKFDKSDKKNPKSDLVFSLAGALEDETAKEEGSMTLSFITLDKKAFIKIGDHKLPFAITMFVPQIKDLLKEYKDKWIELPEEFVPDEIQDQLDEETEEEKKIRELAQRTDFFEILNDYGTEKLDGVEVYHYDVLLDKDNFREFALEVAKIQGREIEEDEKDDMNKSLDNLKVQMSLWIGTSDKLPYKVDATIEGKDDIQNLEFEIKLLGTAGSHNEAQDIKEPTDFTKFEDIEDELNEAMGSLFMPPPGMMPPEGLEGMPPPPPPGSLEMPLMPIPGEDGAMEIDLEGLEGMEDLEGMDIDALESQLDELEDSINSMQKELEDGEIDETETE